MTKIRFLATGDIHSDMNLISKIKKLDLSKLDFVIFIGDLSDKKNDFSKLLSPFKNIDFFMVPGNHETKKSLEILQEKYNIHLVGNAPVIINSKLAIFGSNYIPIGPHSLDEKSVLNNMIENFNSVSDAKFKIFLSHMPPADTKLGNLSPYHPFIGGSLATRIFIENFSPDVSLVGHIHEGSGLEEIVNKTRVINVGRTFKIFEFDLKNPKKGLLDLTPK